MSKMQEDKNEKQTGKSFPSMSSRQQILYLMNKTQNETNWNPEEKSSEVERNSLPKHIVDERCKLIKQSMKEFAHIKKNIYIDRKKYAFSDDEAYVCSCEKHPLKQSEILEMEIPFDSKKEDDTFGCGKSCLNKMVSWECVEHLCPAGVSCRNRRFQQHLYEEVFPVKTDTRGWGLCAGEFLPKGTFVMQYIGEIYSIDSHYGQAKLKEYRNKTCTYLMSISKNEVIDPTFKGNLARFINHSCEPNCETQKWHVLGEICVGIFTLRDIQEGEELTFNYGFDILKTTYQKCLCGAKNCKGYLGIVTNNELTKGISNSILCDVCKNGCRGKETIVLCEGCKKIYHKNCVKRTKERKILESIKNYDPASNSYLCNSCIKKKDKETSFNQFSGVKKEITSTNNVLSSLNNLTLSASQNLEIKDKNKDKKSSQELITELKRKKLKKGIIQTDQSVTNISQEIHNNNNNNSNINIEESASNAESSELAQTNKDFLLDAGLSSIKGERIYPGSSNINYVNDNSSVGASSNKIKTVKTIEEDEIIDATIEYSEIDISKIQSSLKTLSNIGARLFWDYRQLSNINPNNLIEVKITGNHSQIEKVKQEIKKIIAEKQVTLDSYSAEINVPKLYVRRIIGHQNRNLISYKSKYNVDIEFDAGLITDDIFQIGENSKIVIKGKENYVKFVEKDIKKLVNGLKVFTFFLMPTDYNYVRNNICPLKTMVDPADLRLRKRDYKIDRDIKHSFYYVPSNHKDLVVIGYDGEIKKAEKIIKEFLLRQNTLNFNYSLCVLCPTYYSNMIDNFIIENSSSIQAKNMILKVYDPVFSRKHLNIYLEGKWKDITELKEMLFKYLQDKDKSRNRAKSNIAEFEQYAFNQEHKLISKNLRKFFLESNYSVKNWDLISEDIWQNLEATKCEPKQKKEKDDYSKLIKEFTRNSDRDTTMNYLLNLPAGSYNSVFNMSKMELTKNLVDYVGECLDSYQVLLKDRLDKKEKHEVKTVSKQENPANICSLNVNEMKCDIAASDDKMIIECDLIENLSDCESEKSLDQVINDEKIEMYTNTELKIQNDTARSQIYPMTIITNVNLPKSEKSLSEVNSATQGKDTINSTQPTLPIKDEKVFNTIQIDKNKISLNNQLLNNQTISAIDNIQSTLLNKLNEIRNENKTNNEMTNLNSNNSVKSNESCMNLNGLNNYGIVVQEDLGILKSLKSSQSTVVNNVPNQSEIMNISYNFSNINQMNININISSIKDLMNETNLNSLNINQGKDNNLIQNNNLQNEQNFDGKESIEENLSKYEKYDKYSDKARDKEYQLLRKKFKPTQNIEPKSSRNSYYKEKERERERERERMLITDKDRVGTNVNYDYNYNYKQDTSNSARYAVNRRYYNNHNTSSANFSNYNYTKTRHGNNYNDNMSKTCYQTNHYTYNKIDRPRFSRSNSLEMPSRSRSVSLEKIEDKSDSYSLKMERSKYNERKRNINLNLDSEHRDKNKKEAGNYSPDSRSASQSQSMRSSSSTSSYSSSSSRSIKRELNSNSNKYKHSGGIMSNNYKPYNRRIHYTHNNQTYTARNFPQAQGDYNNSANYIHNKPYYDNNMKSFNRSGYYKPGNMQKYPYQNTKYYNSYYSHRYNRYTRRSRSDSGSRSHSKDILKEFLRLKKKESENLSKENLTQRDVTNSLPYEVIELKSCLRKPNNFN